MIKEYTLLSGTEEELIRYFRDELEIKGSNDLNAKRREGKDMKSIEDTIKDISKTVNGVGRVFFCECTNNDKTDKNCIKISIEMQHVIIKKDQ